MLFVPLTLGPTGLEVLVPKGGILPPRTQNDSLNVKLKLPPGCSSSSFQGQRRELLEWLECPTLTIKGKLGWYYTRKVRGSIS